MDIRPARLEDVPAVLAISNWAAEHTAANFAAEPESLESWETEWQETHRMYPWLVAVDHGHVVAFAKASPWKGRCAYAYTAEVTVYVHPDQHGRGIATALYSKLISTLEAQGYHTLLAGITSPNPASVRLHESFGFRRVALFERIGWKFDRWHDVGYWQANLTRGGRPKPLRPVVEAVSGEGDPDPQRLPLGEGGGV